jgi:mersacidin/lichenicidin family type 2 lantibiotic
MSSLKHEKELYMKFDIVRAWKDESYRQSLSTEQLNTLPGNPAGELSNAEMELVYGGGGGGGGPLGGGPLGGGPVGGGPVGGGAVGAGLSGSAASSHRTHSFAVFCDRNTFSINARRTSTGEIGDVGADLLAIDLISIGNPVQQVCVNDD